jgi:tRNA 2-thiouridine synthesizing protein A
MSVAPAEIRVDEELDLRGEVCPYTFVKSKLYLEEMEVGQVLRVVLDHLPAVDNVPRSMQGEGHEVMAVTQVNDDDWHVTIRKTHE